MTVPQAPFSPSPIPGQVQGVDRRRTLFLEDPHDRRMAAGMLADGAVLGHGFGNIYAITSRPDATTVRAVNLLKGRPADQVGSITTTPTRLPDAFDWSQLPAGLSRSHALDAVDALLALGPCGFRGPAAAGLPSHLTQRDANVLTTQVISPGYACPSNAVFALAGADWWRLPLRHLGQPVTTHDRGCRGACAPHRSGASPGLRGHRGLGAAAAQG
jgi:hypothetical protein